MKKLTPIKNQGQSQFCWAYAMLSTIETEHILRGDSVHLSTAYIERVVKRRNLRGMGSTLLNIIGRYGIVSHDAYPDTSYHQLPQPKWVFMLGARYTPLEFAHSVCAPGEYMALTSNDNYPYGEEVVLDLSSARPARQLGEKQVPEYSQGLAAGTCGASHPSSPRRLLGGRYRRIRLFVSRGHCRRTF